MNEVPTPPETAPEAVKPRFGRKLVIGLVTIAIIATASIIMFTQFLPGARGEAVTLELNYSVGEKMTYEISNNVTMETTCSDFNFYTFPLDTEVSQKFTLEMEVQGFDGENYTIRQTNIVELQEVFSITMKMNKTGYIVEYIELPPEFEQISSFLPVPGFGSYFTKEEVRVGESWEIPFDMEAPAGTDVDGTISYELSEITSVTVPAGTYEALKINVEGSGRIEGKDFHATLNINGNICLEKATCRLIELRFDLSSTTTVMDQTTSMEMTTQMQLTEHLK